MALGLTIDIVNERELREAFRRAPEQTMRRWDRTMRAKLEKGVRIIQKDYRSGPTTTDQRTKRITSNLVSSYGQQVSRQGGTIVGEMGGMRKFEHGNALVYLPVHELGASVRSRSGHVYHIKARPPLGAVEATRRRIQPELIEALRRDVVEVLNR